MINIVYLTTLNPSPYGLNPTIYNVNLTFDGLIVHPLAFPFRYRTSHPGAFPYYTEPLYRQTLPLNHGPERITERNPHTKHIDWGSLFPNDVILHGPPRKEVALTFDDGPDDVWTPRVLDVLARYNIKATFFCVGHRIQQYPQVLRRMFRDGHTIGNHSWNHPNLTKIPITEVRTQIEITANEINRLVGVRPRLFRPPYGALNADVIYEIVSLDYKIILWNVDSLDWAGLTAPQVTANILAHVTPGAIILQHSAGGLGESLADTVQALPKVIETLRKEGYSFVTLPRLLNIPAYT